MKLRQFAAYVRKVFRLHQLARRITDSRQEPEIPAATIWLNLIFAQLSATAGRDPHPGLAEDLWAIAPY